MTSPDGFYGGAAAEVPQIRAEKAELSSGLLGVERLKGGGGKGRGGGEDNETGLAFPL